MVQYQLQKEESSRDGRCDSVIDACVPFARRQESDPRGPPLGLPAKVQEPRRMIESGHGRFRSKGLRGRHGH
jgi:hypothetical protein